MMAERIKLYMMVKRYEAEALSYNGSHRTVALLGMQMCAAALDGKLNRFKGWPDPIKWAPPDGSMNGPRGPQW